MIFAIFSKYIILKSLFAWICNFNNDKQNKKSDKINKKQQK